MLQIKIINLLCHLLQFSAQFFSLCTLQTVVQQAGLDYSLEHSNSRFESIRFDSLCESIRIDSFCKKNRPFDSLVVMQFLH